MNTSLEYISNPGSQSSFVYENITNNTLFIASKLFLVVYFFPSFYIPAVLCDPTNYKKKTSMAYGTRRFNAAFTGALQQFLSGAESTEFLALIPFSSRSILILSSHLRLGLPKGLFPVGFTC